jgi:hypothetical protein
LRSSAGPLASKRKTKKNKNKNIFIYLFILKNNLGRRQPRKARRGRLRPTGKPRKKKKEKIVFPFFFLVAGDLAELRGAACAQQGNQKLKIKLKIFFYFSYFCFVGLSPAAIRGVKPWEPPF